MNKLYIYILYLYIVSVKESEFTDLHSKWLVSVAWLNVLFDLSIALPTMNEYINERLRVWEAPSCRLLKLELQHCQAFRACWEPKQVQVYGSWRQCIMLRARWKKFMNLLNKTYVLDVRVLIRGLASPCLLTNFFSTVANSTEAARPPVHELHDDFLLRSHKTPNIFQSYVVKLSVGPQCSPTSIWSILSASGATAPFECGVFESECHQPSNSIYLYVQFSSDWHLQYGEICCSNPEHFAQEREQ